MKRLRGDQEATHPTGRWRMGLAGGMVCERINKDEAEKAGIGQIFAGGGRLCFGPVSIIFCHSEPHLTAGETVT